ADGFACPLRLRGGGAFGDGQGGLAAEAGFAAAGCWREARMRGDGGRARGEAGAGRAQRPQPPRRREGEQRGRASGAGEGAGRAAPSKARAGASSIKPSTHSTRASSGPSVARASFNISGAGSTPTKRQRDCISAKTFISSPPPAPSTRTVPLSATRSASRIAA